MNCAYHPDQGADAYCRTCGKPLCANCTRPVRGVIYCEDCLSQRMEAPRMDNTRVAPAFVPASAATPPPPRVSGSGPNPTVAGILAGFFPFGVGAVYTGQYAKGLAHLAIFALLVAGCNVGNSEILPALCGVGIAFFVVYQIIDAVRTARALQAGLPAPDPYGLGATFGGVTKVDTSKVPIGAIVLILLGGLFLLNTMGLSIGLDRFWPLILIAIGAWLFARNWGPRPDKAAKLQDKMARHGVSPAMQDAVVAMATCQCGRCRARRLMGPAVLVTIGFLFLFETLGRVSFGHSWPILLLVIGGVKLYQSTASAEGHIPPTQPMPPANLPPPPASPPASSGPISSGPASSGPTPPTEVSHG